MNERTIFMEALGKESVSALQKGLKSPEPLVQFAAAEALLYLGSTSGVEKLAGLAVAQPQVRAYALIALAGLNESVCRIKLHELLIHNNPELRAGAFQALRLTYAHECPTDKELDIAMRRLGGENLQAFWLHQIPVGGPQAVNFAETKRAEIVLFGKDIHLVAPVRLQAGEEFTIRADANDSRCTISRISQRTEQARQCSLRLDDVLRTFVELGGQYPEAVDLLAKLHEQQGLNCPVDRLAPPQATPLEELVSDSRNTAKTRMSGRK